MREGDPFLPAGWPRRHTTVLGLLSDTHMPERWPSLPPALFQALHGVDLLLHAGDVGELWVLDQLSAIAPVVAVHGNDEPPAATGALPYQQTVVAAGQRVVVTHAHFLDRQAELASRVGDEWGPKLDHRAAFGHRAGASLVVFGHTHIPMAVNRNGVLLINPGALASGNYITRQTTQTVARLYLRDDGARQVTHVDLAAPDRPYDAAVNLATGFRAALDRYSASIVTPDLASRWSELWRTGRQAPELFREALLPLCHRRWAGDPSLISGAELLAALGEASVPAGLLAEIERILSGE